LFPPEPYRQALILTAFEGISQAELAQKLGLSFSGAKSRVQRGRQMLRDRIYTNAVILSWIATGPSWSITSVAVAAAANPKCHKPNIP
jgi:transcriptional regulator with XRE-family HTH domain